MGQVRQPRLGVVRLAVEVRKDMPERGVHETVLLESASPIVALVFSRSELHDAGDLRQRAPVEQ